jgi:hypothetical protein
MNVAAVNWDAVTAIGQAVGALGVIVSLIYLGLQVRADARARRAQTMLEIERAYSDVMASISHHADLSDILIRAGEDMSSLTNAELYRFLMLQGQVWRAFEYAFLQYRHGHLKASEWQGFQGPINHTLALAQCRAAFRFWELGGNFHPEFAALVKAKLAAIPESRTTGLFEAIRMQMMSVRAGENPSPAAATASAATAAGGAATHSGG